jgi:hypothetical protein
MPEKQVVLLIDRPHFEVKVHSDALELNLKEGVKKEIERLAEARPILQETLGWVFQTIIPLNVRLWEIERAEVDAGGRVSLVIPHRRDLHIPLDPADGRRLVDKLNQLMPVEKAREMERVRIYDAAQREHDKERSDALHFPRKAA